MSTLSVAGDGSLFQLLVECVQDYAIFALDTNGEIVSWNRGARQIKGYSEEEVFGRHFSLFFRAEDRAAGRPERLLAEARAKGRTTDEGWRVRKDGTRFWASVVITALRAPDGQLVGYAKVTRDLTERRAAEETLRERQRQLLETQALAGLGSWEWDVAANRVVWTDELYRIYGVEPSAFDATFEAYLSLVHPEDRDRVRAEVESAFRDRGFEFEERIVRPDGDVRVLRSRGRARVDDAGETTHLVGSCLDITDLRRAQEDAVRLGREQAAREAAEAHARSLRFLVRASAVLASSMDYESTLRNVASLAVPDIADWCVLDLLKPAGELSRVAVVHADPERTELARRLQSWPPDRAMTGVLRQALESGETLLLREIPDALLHAEAASAQHIDVLVGLGFRSAICVPLEGRAGKIGTLTLVHADPARTLTEHDEWVATELGRHAAEAIENARLHRDLEERNRMLEEQSTELEQQTEELQAQVAYNEELVAELETTNQELQERTLEAEQANRAKSEFLATMSHELRTPLNAIFGYADLIQLGLHGPVTSAQLEALERIKRNQHALLVLINDVLHFAKLQAAGLEIVTEPVPVAEVLSELEKTVGLQLQAKELRYVCAGVPPGLSVLGDRERIQQILLNLLTNAIKFTEPGGAITISADSDGPAVRIHVRDTGRGIPSNRLESIFDPFVQVDRHPLTAGDGGVGLGLAISRDLAHAMGGTLSAESTPGMGSIFTLELPAAG